MFQQLWSRVHIIFPSVIVLYDLHFFHHQYVFNFFSTVSWIFLMNKQIGFPLILIVKSLSFCSLFQASINTYVQHTFSNIIAIIKIMQTIVVTLFVELCWGHYRTELKISRGYVYIFHLYIQALSKCKFPRNIYVCILHYRLCRIRPEGT